MDSIPVQNFYGKFINKLVSDRKKMNSDEQSIVVPFKSKSLLSGPCLTWKVFNKQQDALDFVRNRKTGLMTFSFEQSHDQNRLFLVADPQVFWHYDNQRGIKNRHSYEVIAENVVTKLYFDLEFIWEYNKTADQIKMVSNFIRIVNDFLKQIWNIDVDNRTIVNLDSSTPVKFSCHLIYTNTYFINNYNIGNFVKYVCNSIVSAIETKCELSGVSDLHGLIVTNSKEQQNLFCDLCVYSKNRNFRVFKSSKIAKNIPLILSESNLYSECDEKQIFLDTLITYVKEDVDKIRILEYRFQDDKKKLFVENVMEKDLQPSKNSPFREIDKFVETLIQPNGHVYRCFYLPSSSFIVYDIVGYRYCGNIGRHHKSNNIKYIVDLTHYCYYQKCYDVDCSNYKSMKISLPNELIFLISDNSDILDNNENLGNFELFDESNLCEFLDEIESKHNSPTTSKNSMMKFPSFGLSDDAFESVT